MLIVLEFVCLALLETGRSYVDGSYRQDCVMRLTEAALTSTPLDGRQYNTRRRRRAGKNSMSAAAAAQVNLRKLPASSKGCCWWPCGDIDARLHCCS